MPGIHFSKQILVAPFSLEDEKGSAYVVHQNKEYSFLYILDPLKTANFVLPSKIAKQ